jgi:hypothetical protein
MAGRSGDTFKKRQKEVARAEKRQEKTARRMERKLKKGTADAEPEVDEFGVEVPQGGLSNEETHESEAS